MNSRPARPTGRVAACPGAAGPGTTGGRWAGWASHWSPRPVDPEQFLVGPRFVQHDLAVEAHDQDIVAPPTKDRRQRAHPGWQPSPPGSTDVRRGLLKRVQVDGERPVTTVDPVQHPVVRGGPPGKLPEVVADAFGVGAEIMRSVLVDQHADAVVEIVGVPGNVGSPVDHQTAFVQLAGQSFGKHCAREPRADDEIIIVRHGRGKAEGGRRGAEAATKVLSS